MVQVRVPNIADFPEQTKDEHSFYYLAHVSCSITVWANEKERTRTVSEKPLFVHGASDNLFIKNKEWTNIDGVVGERSDFQLEETKPFYQISTLSEIRIKHIQSRFAKEVLSEAKLRQLLLPHVL